MSGDKSVPDDGKFSADGLPESDSTRAESLDPSSPPLGHDAPSRIGRYELKSVLGRGGFGTVYQGWDTSLQRAVAIKLLNRASVENRLKMWMEEARTVAALDHPSIVPVYDVGITDDGCGYMVSKLIEGGSLTRHLEKNRLDFVASASVVSNVADALDYAHRHQVVHRDVKPGNILITATGEAVLADFGLALHESAFGEGARFVGTPAYMSPEQARHEGHRVDGRSDVYSVGVVLYELLVGVRPFRAATADELLDCIRNIEVRPLRQINRQIPKELERICLKSLSKRAADRHTTAGDLAEDLSRWIRETQVTTVAEDHESTGNVSDESTGSQSLETVSVVPRGLRPFDAADADFFLHLLPGARDREGVPESVRFWRNLINETREEATFRVGVLLGPSGSGKSSLVRAGIVPRLDPAVIVLRLEARPEGFEQHLLRQLRITFPELKQSATAAEALSWVRSRRGLAQGAKLLLVIDQFEQWLNHNAINGDHHLLEALRQCDGVSVQTLLLVRDDFMLSVAEFMNALEEPLLQNHNFATVDLFGADHTQEVLTAFGRAYGTIDDPPSSEQQRFLDAAVKELSSHGRVVPVHLALFADMIKDKPWTPAALKGLGGTRGVGIAFLEERLSGSAANPFFLSHAVAVRRLLSELLPADDSAIKPPARTLAELSESLRDMGTQEWLERLLGLLDTEVRLVTPSGRAAGPPDSSGSASESGSLTSSREPRYQLTHDYLVPSIRNWLAVEDRRSRAGRARLRLRELAHAWEVRPETRRLPSVAEWMSIRGLTRSNTWSEIEQRMMTTASRRIAVAASLLLALGLSVWLVAGKAYARSRSDTLAQRLVNADTSEVASILQEGRDYEPGFSEAVSHLQQEESDPRRKLNTSLALAQRDPSHWHYLLDHLDDVRVENLQHVRDLTVGQAPNLQDDVWSRLESADADHRKLLLSTLIAKSSPEDERWEQYCSALVDGATLAQLDNYSDFVELLSPLQNQLSSELLTRLKRPNIRRDQIQHHQLIRMAAVYLSAKSPQDLTEAISAVTPDELPEFMTRATGDRRVLASALRKRFTELHRQLGTRIRPLADTEPLATLQQRLTDWGGFLDGNSGLADAVPRDEFESLTRSLAEVGYEPVCVRPFTSAGESFVSGVWHRGNGKWRIHWDLAPDEVIKIHSELESQGFHLRDMAWGVSATAQRQLSALWIKPTDSVPAVEQITLLDVAIWELLAKSGELGPGWGVDRFTVSRGHEGEMRCAAVFRKAQDQSESSMAIRARSAFGDRSPGALRSDIRFTWLDADQPDRALLYQAMAQLKRSAVQHSGTKATNDKLRVANYLSAAKQFAEADRQLASLAPPVGEERRWKTYSTYLAARSRDIERLEKEIEWFLEKGMARSSALFRLQAAVFRGDAAQVTELLETHRETSSKSRPEILRYVLALAVAASEKPLGDLAIQATDDFYRVAREAIDGRRLSDPALLFSYVDFDGLRQTKEFQDLMRENGFHQCFTTASYSDTRYESRILFGLAPAAHRSKSEALRRNGFQPISICSQVDSRSGEHEICSAWRRSVLPPTTQTRINRSLGNLAIVLAHLGESDIWQEGLNDRFGRDVRSYLILNSPVLLPATELMQALRASRTPTERRTIVQALGSYPVDDLKAVDREYVKLQLQGWASSADDSGLRHSSDWLRRRWEIPLADDADRVNQSQKSNHWFVNSLDQTMIVVQPPELYMMGSPEWEEERKENMDEFLHHARLGHDFAMSATEVTVKQFHEFWNSPKAQAFYGIHRFDYNRMRAPSVDCPQIEVTWLHAARFCQWLSEREGIPESQWCYPGVWDPNAKEILLPKDYRLRTGYRLPTQMEWEYAARSGTPHARYCGDDPQLLAGFEWALENSGIVSHDVGTLRPNDFGFWDMLGNVMEWTGDRNVRLQLPYDGHDHEFDTGSPEGFPGEKDKMIMRGGYYNMPARSVRAAERHSELAGEDPITIGFRVAKTVDGGQ